MDIMMPEMDGYETMQVIRQNASLPAVADYRPDSESHEGRSRKVPGSGRVRVSGQAGEYRTAAVSAAHVAAPVDVVTANGADETE